MAEYVQREGTQETARQWDVSASTVVRCVAKWRTALGLQPRAARCEDAWVVRYQRGESAHVIAQLPA
jgi:hypothetical protein